MKKTTFIITGVIVAIILLVALAGFILVKEPSLTDLNRAGRLDHDPKNTAYVIEGKIVTLANGLSEVEVVPGSASKITTRYFGNEARGDLNQDGREDVVFLLTQSTSGTGIFYYVVAALNTPAGYIGSQGLLLGDRIAPQTTEMSKEAGKESVVIVNYADRKAGESFATPPSVGKSIWLKLDPTTREFGEVVQNFEGEADPSKMTLGMKSWTWIKTSYNNDTEVMPHEGKVFTVTFGSDGRFSTKTDCNSVSGKYTVKGSFISFEDMMSTMMYCEGSQESEFIKMIGDSQNYHFTSRGELILGIKFDSGSMIFR